MKVKTDPGITIGPPGTSPGPDRLVRLKERLRSLHHGVQSISDSRLDAEIGLRPQAAEPTATLSDMILAYGNHRFERGDLRYDLIRELFLRLPEGARSSLVDLGCGYGRIGFYGALLLPDFRFWGVEILPERVEEARRARDRWGLANLDIVQGDAVTEPWPEAETYALMNPDYPDASTKLLRRLEGIAQSRSIIIASISTVNLRLESLPCLREVGDPPEDRLALRLFSSG